MYKHSNKKGAGDLLTEEGQNRVFVVSDRWEYQLPDDFYRFKIIVASQSYRILKSWKYSYVSMLYFQILIFSKQRHNL